jgi:hypothetical protein
VGLRQRKMAIVQERTRAFLGSTMIWDMQIDRGYHALGLDRYQGQGSQLPRM